MEPIPEYFGMWQIARWIGVTPDVLEEMPVHEVEQARVVMTALNRAQNEANDGKKGRR